MNKLIFT